jgi:hypothetical protein
MPPLVQLTLSSTPPDLVVIIWVKVELSEQISNFDSFMAVNEFLLGRREGILLGFEMAER